jgi:hypothetical protein
MATPGRPRFSALDHPTRQQLDELDALMQRMLALPVNPVEEPQDEGRAESAPLAAANETVEESAAKNGLADSVLQRESQQELPGTPAPVVGTEHGVPGTPYPVPRTEVRIDTRNSVRGTPPAAPPHLPSIPSPARTTAAPEAVAQPPRLAWPLRPLLWLNVAFDSGTAWLGPFGRWLRGPSGRALLGWGGLLLLAAALAWIAWDGMAWTW